MERAKGWVPLALSSIEEKGLSYIPSKDPRIFTLNRQNNTQSTETEETKEMPL